MILSSHIHTMCFNEGTEAFVDADHSHLAYWSISSRLNREQDETVASIESLQDPFLHALAQSHYNEWVNATTTEQRAFVLASWDMERVTLLSQSVTEGSFSLALLTQLIERDLGNEEVMLRYARALEIDPSSIYTGLLDLQTSSTAFIRYMGQKGEQIAEVSTLSKPENRTFLGRVSAYFHKRTVTRLVHQLGETGRSVGNSRFVLTPDNLTDATRREHQKQEASKRYETASQAWRENVERPALQSRFQQYAARILQLDLRDQISTVLYDKHFSQLNRLWKKISTKLNDYQFKDARYNRDALIFSEFSESPLVQILQLPSPIQGRGGIQFVMYGPHPIAAYTNGQFMPDESARQLRQGIAQALGITDETQVLRYLNYMFAQSHDLRFADIAQALSPRGYTSAHQSA